jgi:hypothetical protein
VRVPAAWQAIWRSWEKGHSSEKQRGSKGTVGLEGAWTVSLEIFPRAQPCAAWPGEVLGYWYDLFRPFWGNSNVSGGRVRGLQTSDYAACPLTTPCVHLNHVWLSPCKAALVLSPSLTHREDQKRQALGEGISLHPSPAAAHS